MKISKRIKVPTGDICVVNGQKGDLEFISVGDYGKDVNLKCDAMGLDRKPSAVRHTELVPLTEKWVITISTQYGCSIEKERYAMFNGNAHSLEGVAKIMNGIIPNGRKITLNFAIADYEIFPSKLLKYFDPDDYIIKLTPMHKTITALKNDIFTNGDYTQYYPYEMIEKNLTSAGYDVIVFIASEYEDLGMITCGNAILSGQLPKIPYELIDMVDNENI